MFAGILGSQGFYLLHVLVPAVTVGTTTLFGSAYLTWDFALWGMLLSLVLTVGVSAVTSADAFENVDTFAVDAD
jgi:SSS family solute:Na+ symporter